MAMSARSCSWCHHWNVIHVDDAGNPQATLCLNCGHRADLARMHCDCQQCNDSRDRAGVPRNENRPA